MNFFFRTQTKALEMHLEGFRLDDRSFSLDDFGHISSRGMR